MGGFLDHLMAFAKRDADDMCCPDCGDNIYLAEISAKAFEYSGKIICTPCYEQYLDQDAIDNSQFGVGA